MAENLDRLSPVEASPAEDVGINWGPKTLAFLAAIRARPSITRAAEAAGVSRESHYRRLERSKPYRKAFDLAYGQGVEALEDEAVRRAHDGVKRPVLYHGVPVMMPIDPNNPEAGYTPLMEVEYSDQILLALLKAKKPDVYKDRVSQEVTGEGGGPIKTSLTVHFVREPFERGTDNTAG